MIRFAFLALSLVASIPARAQVEASLVAADRSIQPGRPMVVALHLVHRPHWHTYWVNPGTGVTTTLAWQLPAGWTASAIQWPVPRMVTDEDGHLTGIGYGDDVLLPLTLMPPASLAPGGTVHLQATAKWLMCRDACMPGQAVLSLDLPVAAEAPAPDSAWKARIDAALSALPRPDATWAVAAKRIGNRLLLTVKSAGAAGRPGAPGDLRFYCDDNFIGFELPQVVTSDGRDGYLLSLQVATDDGPPTPDGLHGVIAASGSWRSDQTLPGLRVDLPLP